MSEPRITITEPSDPREVERFRRQDEQSRRNAAWVDAHWAELLPRARGKFLAISGQEAFIADTAEEAWSLARAAHPNDAGVLVQFVRA